MNVVALAIGGAVGLLAALLIVHWLSRRSYRLEDERGLPERSSAWLYGVLPLSTALEAQSFHTEPVYAAVAVLYTCALGALADIDFDTRRLPSFITLPLIPATALGVVAAAVARGGAWEALLRALVCGLVLFLVYLVLVLVGRGAGMGEGDLKLSASLGMLLGYLSAAHVFVGTFAGFVSGFLYGLFLVLFRGGGRKTTVAFGPHMALGAVAVLVLPALVTLF